MADFVVFHNCRAKVTVYAGLIIHQLSQFREICFCEENRVTEVSSWCTGSHSADLTQITFTSICLRWWVNTFSFISYQAHPFMPFKWIRECIQLTPIWKFSHYLIAPMLMKSRVKWKVKSLVSWGWVLFIVAASGSRFSPPNPTG